MTLALVLLLSAAQTAPPVEAEEAGAFRACLMLPPEQAVPLCREALAGERAAAQRVLLLRMLAAQLASLERWQEAVDAYARWVALDPEEPEAQRRYGEVLLVATGRAAEAAEALREAVRLAPGDARAHGWLGVALNALGRHAEAVRAFEDALGMDPTYFSSRPAARAVFEAAQRGVRWPPPGAEPEGRP